MPRFAVLAQAGMLAGLAVVVASACGGQSFENGSGGDAGSAHAGRAGQGGSGSHAGTTSAAGKSHAGNGAGGSSAGSSSAGNGSAGSTGSGGAATAEACTAPPVGGPCEAAIQSWYNDPATGICRPFIYGGCEGNANRYPSLQACQKACPGGSPNYDACKLPSDCRLAGTGCCGICDGPNVTAHSLIAYNKQYASVLECVRLDDPGVGGASSSPIACQPCPEPGPGTLQYFVPDCIAGQCAITDLRNSVVTSCTRSAECKLRYGLGCCEGCGGGQIFSVRNDGSFEELLCGGGLVACPGCVPQKPPGLAYCEEGRCQVATVIDEGAQ